jgi:hypothetical protein
MVENVDEFEKWIEKMLKDAKKQLHMTDETMTYILLREGLACYYRTINKEKR